MNDIVIHPMEKEDLDAIMEISIASFPITWSRESFERELSNNFARYMVAKRDNKIIGYAGMWVIIDEAHITNIAICPEERGKGIGSLLLQTIIEICKRECASHIFLEVRASNLCAQNLYTKYGFQKEGLRKKYYEDNREDAILMGKPLG